jgi:hypothetical protein
MSLLGKTCHFGGGRYGRKVSWGETYHFGVVCVVVGAEHIVHGRHMLLGAVVDSLRGVTVSVGSSTKEVRVKKNHDRYRDSFRYAPVRLPTSWVPPVPSTSLHQEWDPTSIRGGKGQMMR